MFLWCQIIYKWAMIKYSRIVAPMASSVIDFGKSAMKSRCRIRKIMGNGLHCDREIKPLTHITIYKMPLPNLPCFRIPHRRYFSFPQKPWRKPSLWAGARQVPGRCPDVSKPAASKISRRPGISPWWGHLGLASSEMFCCWQPWVTSPNFWADHSYSFLPSKNSIK